MNITLNGEPRTLPDACDVAFLLDDLELTGKRLAVEINREIVPRSQFGETRIAEGDNVEIVHAIGGG